MQPNAAHPYNRSKYCKQITCNTSLLYCLASYGHLGIPGMFICPTISSHYLFRYLALAILPITLVQGFKSPSYMNISEPIDINGHIKTQLMSKPEKQSCMNYSTLEPVLFEKLHNIKLSQSVFRVTTFFQLKSTKAVL